MRSQATSSAKEGDGRVSVLPIGRKVVYASGMEDKLTLQELRQRYFVDRRWKELADVLEKEIPLTEDREERLGLYEELGTVCIEHLEDAERAFEAFRVVADLREWTDDEVLETFAQILEFAPDFFPAFQRVEEVLRRRRVPLRRGCGATGMAGRPRAAVEGDKSGRRDESRG